MRKPVKPQEAIKQLTKGEVKAVEEINEEVAFAKTYAPELRDILYHCQQLAKAQDNLLVLTGKLNTEDRINHQRQTENLLFEAAFQAVY